MSVFSEYDTPYLVLNDAGQDSALLFIFVMRKSLPKRTHNLNQMKLKKENKT